MSAAFLAGIPREGGVKPWAPHEALSGASYSAVELARTLSTDDSPRFLNGVLGRIADIAEHLRATR